MIEEGLRQLGEKETISDKQQEQESLDMAINELLNDNQF